MSATPDEIHRYNLLNHAPTPIEPLAPRPLKQPASEPPEDAEWIIERLADLAYQNDFAQSLATQYRNRGTLTDKQWTAARKTIERNR